ncbi:S8 family peptidase [Melittangium boletus]|uniref:Extracellular protease n=1 Tax=Melittangium boletus DSM 14713 TaxID=1294270 RepID=A0A250IJ43_9BACT|nr:S8 family peptidase [Melittangium boletus]ATB30976.1 extracellular protease [Melittangium boletus DSM 14713]
MIRRIALLGFLALAACGEEEKTPSKPTTPTPTVKTGTVSGVLTPFRSASSLSSRALPSELSDPRLRHVLSQAASKLLAAKRQTQQQALSSTSSSTAETVPGDVIVRFEESHLPEAEALARVEVPGYRAVHKGHLSEHWQLIGYEPLTLRALRAGETEDLAQRVSTQKGVRFAEKNVRVRAFATPNDPGYPSQWHYPMMNLPAAWDVTTGSDAVTIAIVDSGIVKHPDLDARVVQGADVILDASAAGDGDGRDMDPTDVGADLPNGGSSFHGTHVAGTIGASSNDGYGVAGITWRGKIVPVRALGAEGGAFADIIVGVRWAAGLEVSGLPVNKNPAQVINMSLGGETGPSVALQEAIDEVVKKGVIIVVAAGNSNVDASAFSPCNQRNVICVGATRFDGKRASYSNYGTPVDVMATGGETSQDLDGDEQPDGVLSTLQDKDKKPVWAYYQGTSMASPHVAGIVALMKAKKPTLTTEEAETILKETADVASKCSEGCGAGLVNAHTAVLRAAGTLNTSAAPKLSLAATQISFPSGGTFPLSVRNVGGGSLRVTARVSGAGASALSLGGGGSVTVPAYGAASLPVLLSTSGLADGDYEARLDLSGDNGDSAPVKVKFRVGSFKDQDAILFFLYEDSDGELTFDEDEGVGLVSAANNYSYSAKLTARTYYAIATIDEDGDDKLLEDGERVGFWRDITNLEPIVVGAGKTVRGIDFALVPTMFSDN